jgi:hypothetical protein
MTQEIFHIVHLIKDTKTSSRWFVVLKRTPEFSVAYFHGIGIWTTQDPTDVVEWDIQSMREEYIPWHRIDHITDCRYKPR